MRYDLDGLDRLSRKLGFQAARPSAHRLNVTLADDVVLVFANLVEESDTLVGFDGTPWHAHGKLMLMLDQSHYIELDEHQLLSAIKAGDVVVVERFIDSALEDRWVAHKSEPFDVKHIEPAEELRIRRLS